MSSIAELVKSGAATIIDVRTREEFAGGHVAGSINIPLNELSERLDEMKQKDNLVLCCLSGGRSARAVSLLAQNGISAINGGSWMDVKYYCSLN